MAFDVITPSKLGQLGLTAVIATVSTVPSLSRYIVKTIDICNTSTVKATATIYLVPSGGAASDATTLIPSVDIGPKGMFQWGGAQVMNEGDTIQAISSTSGVTLNVSGAYCT